MAAPFGERIRELRKRKGMTLDQLAAATESSKSYIWELENKDPPRPSAEKVAKIASVLGVTADYLMNTTKAAPGKDVLDQAFFREYQGLDESTKEKLRELVKVWGKLDQ
jgi:transcriptional regulator with XRE-family HTH domain